MEILCSIIAENYSGQEKKRLGGVGVFLVENWVRIVIDNGKVNNKDFATKVVVH